MTTSFEGISGLDLEKMDDTTFDSLTFGVVGLNADGVVERYNATESSLAGLRRETVMGSEYFDEIAQCMNNFLVAQRFEDEDQIDDVIPYVLTLRMRPTPVRLRLLKGTDFALRYILILR